MFRAQLARVSRVKTQEFVFESRRQDVALRQDVSTSSCFPSYFIKRIVISSGYRMFFIKKLFVRIQILFVKLTLYMYYLGSVIFGILVKFTLQIHSLLGISFYHMTSFFTTSVFIFSLCNLQNNLLWISLN